MEFKEAVATAKRYVAELLAEEEPQNIGLEEIVYDDADDIWSVTVGFSRPWNSVRGLLGSPNAPRLGRTYRVVKIRDSDGQPLSMTKRTDISD